MAEKQAKASIKSNKIGKDEAPADVELSYSFPGHLKAEKAHFKAVKAEATATTLLLCSVVI